MTWNYKDPVFQLLIDFCGQQGTITVPRALITLTGDIKTAVLLSQIIFWSEKKPDDDGWFYKTYSQWEEEITLSKHEVSKAAERLTEVGVIEVKVRQVDGHPKLHYRFSISGFRKWIVKKTEMESEKNGSDLKYPFSPPQTPPLIPSNTHLKDKKLQTQENLLVNSEEVQFSLLSPEDYPAEPQINFPKVWNDLVPEAQVRWNWLKDKPHKDWDDPEFKLGFKEICAKASAILKVRGDGAGWIRFRNLFSKNPQTRVPKWRALLHGEFDFLLHQLPEKKTNEVVYTEFDDLFPEK